MCPERTLEGKALQELRELPQIVGADDQAVADRAAAVFRRLTNSIVSVSGIETAEIMKLVSNTLPRRAIRVRQRSRAACAMRSASAPTRSSPSGKLGYSRTNIPLPGLVGGPCLEKDPHILLESARTRGIALEITSAGRLVNERQPEETVRVHLQRDRTARPARVRLKINVLGMAFKGQPETGDLRGSMSIKVLDALKKAHPDAEIGLYDPVTPQDLLAHRVPRRERTFDRFGDAVSGASVVVIANNHPSLGTHLAAHDQRVHQPRTGSCSTTGTTSATCRRPSSATRTTPSAAAGGRRRSG